MRNSLLISLGFCLSTILCLIALIQANDSSSPCPTGMFKSGGQDAYYVLNGLWCVLVVTGDVGSNSISGQSQGNVQPCPNARVQPTYVEAEPQRVVPIYSSPITAVAPISNSCAPVATCPPVPTCPSAPSCPQAPSCLQAPSCPSAPNCPAAPSCPSAPNCPSVPTCPPVPSCPSAPNCPSAPSCPSPPNCPAAPSCPSAPNCPAAPSCPSPPNCPAAIITTTTTTTTTTPLPPPPAPIMKCPPGTILMGGICRLLQCNLGYTLHNGVCIRTECPYGMIWSISKCIYPEQRVHDITFNQNLTTRLVHTGPPVNIVNTNNLSVNSTLNSQFNLKQVESTVIDNDCSEEKPGCQPSRIVETPFEPPAPPRPYQRTNCCDVYSPRTCRPTVNTKNHWTCHSKRSRRCGEFCVAPVIHLRPEQPRYQENMLVMTPDIPLSRCRSRGACRDSFAPYDCSGCSIGRPETCSSYCYSSPCESNRCQFVDQRQYCQSNPRQFGCQAEQGCYGNFCSGSGVGGAGAFMDY